MKRNGTRVKKLEPVFDPMQEVIELENKIRSALKGKKKYPAALLSDAEKIMAGRPTRVTGTRLERLHKIVEQLGKE